MYLLFEIEDDKYTNLRALKRAHTLTTIYIHRPQNMCAHRKRQTHKARARDVCIYRQFEIYVTNHFASPISQLHDVNSIAKY